jgi:hypothetical protein
VTRLTSVFGPERYRQVPGDALVLFVVTAKGAVELATGDRRRSPRIGETIVALTRTASADDGASSSRTRELPDRPV